MLAEGIQLMLVGMVTVFSFLALLVGLMRVSSALLGAFGDRFDDLEGAEAAGLAGLPVRSGHRATAPQAEEQLAVALAAIEAARRQRSSRA